MQSIASSDSSVFLLNDDLNSGVSESLLDYLSNVSQCSDCRCTKSECLQFRGSIKNLRDSLKKGPGSLHQENLVMLKMLHEHYASCSEPNCSVPWCRYLFLSRPGRCQGRVENTQQELMMFLSTPLLTLLPWGTQFNEFIKFDSSLPPEIDRLEEWEHWLTVSSLSHSFTVVLATPRIPCELSKHWVVKMVYTQEEDNQLQALKKLSSLQHPHVVRHVWAATCYTQSLLVLCTEFIPGLSVRELLDKTSMLGFRQVRIYLLQVLSALKELHDLDIVFLNLMCSNLVLDHSLQSIKLTNFSTAIDLSSETVYTETIRLMLPPDVVPIELIRDEQVTHRSDIWGLGCMVQEMLTGSRPWHHLRHDSREHTWREIQKKVPPDLPEDLPQSAQLMIQSCLQRAPDSRLSARDLMEHIHAQMD